PDHLALPVYVPSRRVAEQSCNGERPPQSKGRAHPMTFAATLHRRTATLLASIVAAAAVFVPLGAARTAIHERVIAASLTSPVSPPASLPTAGRTLIDAALHGVKGAVSVIS